MSDRIKLLPDSVANQIAAGEVVNRPSSVVKELIENAVDAGSSNITINFRDGGKALIQVIDDGCGMSPVDARLAFDRHATSKISEVEDIYHIGTFGFRGEALASIASVAEVELRTRRKEDELGTSVEICGGRFSSQSPVSCAVGSQFIIKNLFYNIPARRRFLDKSSTEARHIISEYQRVALCNPAIGFSLYDSDALISKLPPSGLSQRVVGVIGKSIAKNLLDVSANTSIVGIEGFTGRPAGAKQSNKEQFLFVNGRYFKSAYFHKAVVSAYEKLIPANTQPSYFIYLTIDPQRIDVNVHPQKTEVKFSDGSDVWQIINAAVRECLAKSGAVPPMDFELDTSVEIPVYRKGISYRTPEIKGNPDFNPFRDIDGVYGDSRMSETRSVDSAKITMDDEYENSVLEFITGDDATQAELDVNTCRSRRVILPINQRLLATVIDGSLVVVDIRRAYESVLYDRYLLMLGNGNSVCQQLLFPERVTMSIDDISLMKEHLADFSAFGFDISFADEHTVEILGMPADFTSSAPRELIYELLDTLKNGDGHTTELKRTRLATAMSRIGSLSRSRSMSMEEMEALMEQLSACANSSFTPSGNAIMTSMAEEEILKRLK